MRPRNPSSHEGGVAINTSEKPSGMATHRTSDGLRFWLEQRRPLHGVPRRHHCTWPTRQSHPDPNYFYQIKAELYYGDPRRQPEIKYGDRFSNERMALIWVIVLNQRILSDIGGLDDCGEKENVELASMDLVKLRKWRKELTKAKGELDEPADERCWQTMCRAGNSRFRVKLRYTMVV